MTADPRADARRSMAGLPTVALSIRQPWAFSIIHGGKDVENRTWRTSVRGPVLIHAGKGMTADELEGWRAFIDVQGLRGPWLEGRTVRDLQRGGIVGVAEIVDCVDTSPSPWFVGPHAFVLRNAFPLPFMPCKGALGFFGVQYVEPQT